LQFPEPVLMNIELEAPADMPAGARAAEITAILARAIVRSLQPPRAPDARTNASRSEVSLGFSANQRVHTTPSQPEPLC
jgi:hypothetical protein